MALPADINGSSDPLLTRWVTPASTPARGPGRGGGGRVCVCVCVSSVCVCVCARVCGRGQHGGLGVARMSDSAVPHDAPHCFVFASPQHTLGARRQRHQRPPARTPTTACTHTHTHTHQYSHNQTQTHTHSHTHTHIHTPLCRCPPAAPASSSGTQQRRGTPCGRRSQVRGGLRTPARAVCIGARDTDQ
jgi:hypothetical protein